MMVETHAFGNLVPSRAEYLILGSFTGRQAVKGTAATYDAYDWFYGTKRNQFWPILADVYGIELRNKRSKQELFTELGIAMAAITPITTITTITSISVNALLFLNNMTPPP